MKTGILVLFMILFLPLAIQESFACSLSFDFRPFAPFNEYLHSDCSVTTGSLSWTGMIYIVLSLIMLTIIIKRKKKRSRKLYLLIPIIIFGSIVGYSVFIYETLDLTQYAVPHGIHGGIDYDELAWIDTEKDFKTMLEKRNISYSEKNFGSKSDYHSNQRDYDIMDYQILMPAKYCGFVISDEGEEYWYTATFDKTITYSELHLENPYDCLEESKECVCSMQERMRKEFSEND